MRKGRREVTREMSRNGGSDRYEIGHLAGEVVVERGECCG